MASATVTPASPHEIVSMIEGGKKSQIRLAPNTTATAEVNGVFGIHLHGNRIGQIYRQPDSGRLNLVVFSAGWPTVTTAGRLDAIVSAHTGGLFRIGRKNGALEVRRRNGAGGFDCRPMAEGEIFGEVV